MNPAKERFCFMMSSANGGNGRRIWETTEILILFCVPMSYDSSYDTDDNLVEETTCLLKSSAMSRNREYQDRPSEDRWIESDEAVYESSGLDDLQRTNVSVPSQT